MNQRIWLITGVSSGLGKALAHAVVASGDYVIGTLRQATQVEAFNRLYEGKAEALLLDIAQAPLREAVAHHINARFGRLDVLVNNAGIGLAGAVEEASLAEVREVFETNVFGTMHLTQLLLPMMRQQQSGRIIQVSSHGGLKAFPGFGVYNASKFALEGFSEALAAEVAPLGIHASLVEPGPFRTQFAGTSFRAAAVVIEDYHSTAGAFRSRMKQVHGKQEGDPAKAALAMLALSQMAVPPLRMPLGKTALATIQSKLDSVRHDMDASRAVAEGAVFA
ncbi:MAG: oxidoreductase [Cyclobacteriaceae bacterium]|jgi:NAD(P)-dependent dehydrogenase (short-subunit alcohol dehydrogenase family)|nr:oxidoreductase [Cyclobacteriaceae bacterium]